MGILINLLVSAVAVFASAYILPGVHVTDFLTAIIVAIILAVVNAVLKPILVILTLPITIVTLGLFYLVINALMILLVAAIVPGFKVDGFLWAIIYSLVLSIVSSVLQTFTK
jgi:putative membrane protein